MRIIVYVWPDIDVYPLKLFRKIIHFSVHMYYTHPCYRTSILIKKIVRIIFEFLHYLRRLKT